MVQVWYGYEFPDNINPLKVSSGVIEIMYDAYSGKLENYPKWLLDSDFTWSNLRHYLPRFDTSLAYEHAGGLAGYDIYINSKDRFRVISWVADNLVGAWYTNLSDTYVFREPNDALQFKLIWA
jgi:hypothetical protein